MARLFFLKVANLNNFISFCPFGMITALHPTEFFCEDCIEREKLNFIDKPCLEHSVLMLVEVMAFGHV